MLKAAIVMGSDSDLPIMKETVDTLSGFGIESYVSITSAHRTPEKVVGIARRAEEEDWKVLIAGAGMAAHLAGVLAAHTVVPVIGVPMDSSELGGLDALLSTVQMPGGIPVATMGLGSAGAKNAGLLAVHILAAFDPALRQKLIEYREDQRKDLERKAAKMEMR